MSKGDIYQIKTADEAGRSMHVFLKVNTLKKPQLDKALEENSADLDLSSYGEILASCHGRFPTSSVRKKMKEEYNFDC